MYYLFTWDQHYPEGGFNDFRVCSSDLDEINSMIDQKLGHDTDFSKDFHYQVIQITFDRWNIVSEG
jgi:hypothetical protein